MNNTVINDKVLLPFLIFLLLQTIAFSQSNSLSADKIDYYGLKEVKENTYKVDSNGVLDFYQIKIYCYDTIGLLKSKEIRIFGSSYLTYYTYNNMGFIVDSIQYFDKNTHPYIFFSYMADSLMIHEYKYSRLSQKKLLWRDGRFRTYNYKFGFHVVKNDTSFSFYNSHDYFYFSDTLTTSEKSIKVKYDSNNNEYFVRSYLLLEKIDILSESGRELTLFEYVFY